LGTGVDSLSVADFDLTYTQVYTAVNTAVWCST